jgi:hypothetical protein
MVISCRSILSVVAFTFQFQITEKGKLDGQLGDLSKRRKPRFSGVSGIAQRRGRGQVSPKKI